VVSGVEGKLITHHSLVYGNRAYIPRNLKNQWAKHRPPTLPFVSNNNNNNASSNPYANNPPPPSNTNWNDNSYGNNPPPPPQTYQPSSAGQYGQQPKETRGETEHEHGYEWQQAREAERLEREQANGAAPPGYDVAASRESGLPFLLGVRC